MHASRILLLISVLPVLTACGSLDTRINAGYSAPPIESIERQTNLYSKIKAAVSGSGDCFADSTGDKQGCEGKRNNVVAILMSESIALCTEHLNSIYGRDAAFNIATGTISALSSGLAAVSPASRASTLSALSAFSTAERSLVNETVYKTLLTNSISKKISDIRGQKGSALLKRTAEPFATYGMESAIDGVNDFHKSCSFREGLEAALAEGTQSTIIWKREQLESRAQQVMNQINAYAAIKSLQPASYALDENGTSKKITDPFLKSMVDQYLSISREIQSLLPESPAPAAVGTNTSKVTATVPNAAVGTSPGKDTATAPNPGSAATVPAPPGTTTPASPAPKG